jgi:hypothetical protein
LGVFADNRPWRRARDVDYGHTPSFIVELPLELDSLLKAREDQRIGDRRSDEENRQTGYMVDSQVREEAMSPALGGQRIHRMSNFTDIGGVNEHVREVEVVEAASAEHFDLLVNLSTEAMESTARALYLGAMAFKAH